MSSPQSTTFASLLRRYRQAAGLTQAELAERAHLSREAIGTLERGDRRAPRKDTLDLLAEALALTAVERAAFDAAARQQRVSNRQASSVPTLAEAPADAQISSSETPLRLEGGLPLPSSLLPFHVPSIAPPLRTFISQRKWGVALVSGLAVLATLGSVLLLTSATQTTRAGQHPRTLCIATDFPTTGDQARLGIPAENAVQLAVAQNLDLGSGYALKLIPYNDAPVSGHGIDPHRGADNMTDMAQTPCVLGLVGPLSSGVAKAEMPIAANAGLVMISPAATNPGLTLRVYAQLEGYNFDTLHPVGKKTNFFNSSPNDVIQGIVDAAFAFDNLKARGVYVIDDQSPYGEGMAGGFTQGFLLRGGSIVGTESIPFGGIARIAELANRIVATRPDAVFYGGTASGGGALLKGQLVQDGYQGPLIGGDAIVGDPDFVKQAGASPDNSIFASLAVPDLSTFTSGAAAQFLRDYHLRYPGQPVDGYSARTYDAAMVLIGAMKNVIKTGEEVTRSALIDQVQNSMYRGVTGTISFDKNGDIAHGVYSIYSVQSGQWAFFQQVSA
ncbi:MAG TPA: ABC transporter substrate-binding protein [Candidatus Binatia bacterium]|nr:ABC transporter substrate-binding protein [Candidatus Binatia bacterium]